MQSDSEERLRVRVKGASRLMSKGWVGIVRVWFGEEVMEKRGPYRLTNDEAEADAQQLLQEFHEMMLEQPTARYLGTDKAKGTIDEPI